jgi:PDZ domain-containing protein
MAGYGPVNSVDDGSSVEAERAPGASVDATRRGVWRLFHWRKRHTWALVLAFVVAVLVSAALIQLPYYAITPGSAPAVSGLITVPAAQRHYHKGSVLLVYVELTPIRALYYPFFWLDPDAAIYPSGEILGNESAGQYQIEGEIDMSTAQQAATIVALRELGYKVTVQSLGALIYGILPGSPAASALQVGDIISRVNGEKVPTFTSLQGVLEALAPGTEIHVVVSAYPAGSPHTVTLRLGEFRIEGSGGSATLSCFAMGQGRKFEVWRRATVAGGKAHAIACLGIYPQGSGGPSVDGTAFKVGPLPVNVDMASEGIVGPSAGLAFTLGLMQELDPANLTGGLKVAATGTMSIDGTVGDVGGVAQKTVAVREAGANVFFVPPEELAVAKSHAGRNLKVYAVTSIGQVIRILESLGGRLTRTTAR